MRLAPTPLSGSRPPAALQPPEIALAIALTVLALLAALLPATALPAHYHDFADQRAWLDAAFALPHACDVLTNLPFALLGAFMLWRLSSQRKQLSKTEYSLAALTGVGLLATALGSSIYHLQPADAGLALDRAGMGLAFAGVLGLAAATRISDRAGTALAVAVALLAPLAALWDWRTGNMTPWAVLQGGGAALLLVLALRPARAGALLITLWPVLLAYAIAKALELADAPVLALTQGLISGHSAKHLVAALAALPVALAFHRMARRPSAGTMRAAPLQKKVHA